MPMGKLYEKGKQVVVMTGRPSRVTRRARRNFNRRARKSTWISKPLSMIGSKTRSKGMPFGESFHCKLPYVQRVIITTATSDLSVANVFRLGSLFDPDLTGVGHQPLQRDQIAPLYTSYIVHNCKISVTASDPDSDGVWCGIVLRTATNANASGNAKSLQTIMEQRSSNMKAVNNSGNQQFTFNKNITLSKMFGITNQQYNALRNSVYGAPVGSNPTQEAYVEIVAVAVGLASATSTTFLVRLEYDVEFFGYKAPIVS